MEDAIEILNRARLQHELGSLETRTCWNAMRWLAENRITSARGIAFWCNPKVVDLSL